MKITVAAIGRLKEPYLIKAQADYGKRLRRYASVAIDEHADERALIAALPAAAHVYALDERGDLVTSEGFAELLAHEASHGRGAPIAFAIGGPDGHSDALRARARRLLAFGRITIAHRLVRVVLLEQIYRAFTIVRGEPYHRA